MKSLVALALVATSAPALATPSTSTDEASPARERRVCTRIQRRGASRLARQRVCLTATEWRQRFGADWRQNMGGAPLPEDAMDDLDTHTRRVETAPVLGPNP
ncbi:MAG: hypothetical protein QOG13_1945 [Sphingomonadales bacterium]|jgi:hypothetical protein|nr:hypothetical protein [Sphingomonadales bacterium]